MATDGHRLNTDSEDEPFVFDFVWAEIQGNANG